MLSPLLLAVLAAPVPCKGEAGRCVVEVQINGSRLRLLVDSGADITVLTGGAGSRAGISADRDAPVISTRGVGGNAPAVLGRAKIKVGDQEESSVLLAVMPSLALGDIDGLLGMSFLERFRFSVGARALEQALAGEKTATAARE